MTEETRQPRTRGQRKLGPILLSGLIIGPILGSGIILLPPLVYDLAGDYAIVAWILILTVGFLFAHICGELFVLFPGDSGIAISVEHAFGMRARQLAATFLILAGFMGPVAVATTAGEYASFWLHNNDNRSEVYGFLLLLLCYATLLAHITVVSKLSLFLSSSAAALLFGGSLAAIPFFRDGPLVATNFEPNNFGYSVLLLFWSIVGWEIIGNYSTDVVDHKRTIRRAVLYSVIVISVVSLALAGAVQWVDPERLSEVAASEQPRIGLVLFPLLGAFTAPLITALTVALCASTVLMVVGAVARLIADQANNQTLPKLLAYRSSTGVPLLGLLLLLCAHTLVFILLYTDTTGIPEVVAAANVFFLGNAILGVAAGMRLFSAKLKQVVCALLVLIFLLLLSFSPTWLLAVVVGVCAYQLRRTWR